MKKINTIGILAFMIIATLLLSACSLTYIPDNESAFDMDSDMFADRSEIMFDNVSESGVVNEDRGLINYADEGITESDVSMTISAVEGDLIDLQPKAIDPDEDIVEYTFTGPFNEVGLWQTQDGDIGKYLITIGATDGDLVIKEYVLVIINPRNKAPIIECPEEVVVSETDTVNLDCNLYDLEDDVFSLDYSGWMTSDEYTTTYDDAGEYTVLVSARDSENNTVQKEVSVIVKNKNRLPILSGVKDVYATETDIIILDVSTVDSDSDDLIITYGLPFDEDGVWATADGDDGNYASYVQVSDGTDTVTESFNIFIENINTRPHLAPIEDIEVTEGDVVLIKINATDAEDDELTITFSGWMTSEVYATNYDDAGEHYVKVTVSDGQLEVSQNVKVTVNNLNRPPVFVVPG